MKKTPVIVTALAAALVLGGGSSAYAMTHEVDVNAYGKHSTVRTLTGTVGDVLQAEGITPASTDAVSPSLSTPVSADTEITVVKRTPVTITVDGTAHKVLTPGRTVQDALQQLEVQVPQGAVISPAPSTKLKKKGNTVSVTTPKTVTFVGQNGQATLKATEGTVAEAAKAHLSDIQDGDQFDPSGDTALTDGMTIHVKRLRERDTTSTQEIDFSTVTKDDPNLAEGKTEVETEGQKGTKDVVTHEKLTDGTVTESTVTHETVTKKPVDEVVRKGTKKAAAAPSSSASDDSGSSNSSDGSSGSSSSSSSSSGNSSSGSSSSGSSSSSSDQGGTPTGAVNTCTASNYGGGDGTDGGPTASGETFDASAMTAAHKTLPLGTRIKVTNQANGKSVVVRINDRGPYVSGRCLDLSVGAFSAIGSLDSGTMTVSYQVVS